MISDPTAEKQLEEAADRARPIANTVDDMVQPDNNTNENGSKRVREDDNSPSGSPWISY